MRCLNFIIFLNAIFGLKCISGQKPNSCRTFAGYYHIDTDPSCFYNPNFYAELSDLVIGQGYPFETYKTQSEDGYIHQLHRIPRHNATKGVVYLLHPASINSKIWVDRGPHYNLGYLLHDAGYDVWLGNSRGTTYAREHVRLSPEDPKFWDFSFHEMAYYDLPKQLEFVKKTTGQKMTFVGHSMGATIGAVYSAARHEHAKDHLNVAIIMCAGGYFKNVKTPLVKFLVKFTDFLFMIIKSLNYVEFLTRYDLISEAILKLCLNPNFVGACTMAALPIMGVGDAHYDPAFFRYALTIYPGGMPVKAFVHFAQWVRDPNLNYRLYDHGTYGNQLKYGSSLPPRYPVDKIKVPIYLWYGTADILSTIEGNQAFFDELPEVAKIYGMMRVDGYGHADMIIANDAPERIFKPMIKFLDGANFTNVNQKR